MQRVLVFEHFTDPGVDPTWAVTDWPRQTSTIIGDPEDSRESVMDSFVNAFEWAREEIEFFGPILVAPEVWQTSDGNWHCLINADRPRRVNRPTFEEMKAEFIRLWNEEILINHPGPTITETNVDWNMV